MRKHLKRNVCSFIYTENAKNQSYLSMYKHMQHTDVNTGGYITVQTGLSTYIYFCSAYIVIVSFNVCPHVFFLILGFRFQLGTINFYFFLSDIQKFLSKILFIDYKYGDVLLLLAILRRHSVGRMFEARRIHLKRGLFATLRQC